MLRIGIDVGGTKIAVGLFGDDGLILQEKYFVKDIEDLPKFIFQVLPLLCQKANCRFDEAVSLGIGIPGTVSEDGRRVLKAPNLKILTPDFCQRTEDITGIPTRLVQDSRAAAYGEYLFGAGKGKKSIVCVTLGTGIGTGIVLDGKVYDGALGAAGELGHLPTDRTDRACGCGKVGCVECYSAGKGLDMTAAELLGKGMTSADLFDAAKRGNADALAAIELAVTVLGRALTSAINLLSPECLLLSGGLCEQKSLYLDPLIEYIRTHCYRAAKMPEIKRAALGVLSPLYGAAFIPAAEKMKPKPVKKETRARLSASVMCADVLNLGAALAEIEASGIDYIHADIMDNRFVPNLMLPPELLNKLRAGTSLPFDFHIMAYEPESILNKLQLRENDIVSVHYESTPHLDRVISEIKRRGARAAVAINPATPIEALSEILPQIDMVLVMTVNPGFAGQPLAPGSLGKIQRMRKYLDGRGYVELPIEVDGNCSFENVPKMMEAGAEIFVVGTSSVFKSGQTVKEGAEKLYALLQ